MNRVKKSAALCITAIVTACGGGGDNAGECFGGDQVCSGIGNSATIPVVNLSTVTCPELLSISGGSQPTAYALAQRYFAQGAKQLDADNDGDACEEFK